MISIDPIYFTVSFGRKITLIFLTHFDEIGYHTLIKSFEAVTRPYELTIPPIFEFILFNKF